MVLGRAGLPDVTKKMRASLNDADVRALTPVLRAVALRSVSDRTAAADLVQEALLAALEGLAGFDGRCSLRTWVVGILARKAVDHFRRRRRWDEVELGEDDPTLHAPGPSPERELSERQALSRVERALASLPDKERMAVVLCDVEGLGRDEVCNAIGVQASHLRVLLHRARHRLRKSLEDADV